MSRLFSAAAIAVALVSFAAFDVAAAPLTTLYSRPLACAVNHPYSPNAAVTITNTTGKTITKGAVITVVIRLFRRPDVTERQTTYRDIAAGAPIPFFYRSGAPISCSARVATTIDQARLTAKPGILNR